MADDTKKPIAEGDNLGVESTTESPKTEKPDGVVSSKDTPQTETTDGVAGQDAQAKAEHGNLSEAGGR